MRTLITAWTGLLLLGATTAMAAENTQEPAAPTALQQRLERATSPAELVELADQLLSQTQDPQSLAQWAETRERAAATLRALSSNSLKLGRSAFKVSAANAEQQHDLHQAALGDSEAALRLARRYQTGEAAFPVEPHRYVAWLQFAAELGNDAAAYELALFYRTSGQPALAAIYETRAVALGYTVPVALDHVRK
jgi:TPR repeat protein